MKQLFKDGLKLACLSLVLLNPNLAGASSTDNTGLEDMAEIKISCPYKTAADISEDVRKYFREHISDIGLDPSLKILVCVDQLNPDLFSAAWDDMQEYLENLGETGRADLAEKIGDEEVRGFLGFKIEDKIEDKADGDVDAVTFTLDRFFQHNTGRGEEILAKITALQEQISAEADEDTKAPLKHQLANLGKRLHAANHPESRSLPGRLFFDPYILYGDNQTAILETAFMKVAAYNTDVQLLALDEASTEINASNAYIANMLILLRATYQAGDVALSWILEARDEVTTEQADRYMHLSNFYHDFYGNIIGQAANSEALIVAHADFVDIIRGLYHVTGEFPAPVFVTVPSGHDEADAEADMSIAISESKLEATARLTVKMDAILAQLEEITARRSAAGDDAEALAAVEADKESISAHIREIQAELVALV